MPKTLVTTVAVAGLLFSLSACADEAEEADQGAQPTQEQPAEEGQAAPEDQEMPEPDVEDVPDVVAEVNGEEISGEEFITTYEAQFSQMAMQAQMSGEEVDEDQLKDQTLESMIGNELLIQDAEERGFDADEDDVEELLEQTAEENGMESLDELYAAAEEQGTSEEEFRESAANQVLINQLTDELDVEEPTEEELREMYEQSTAQQPEMEEGAEEDETPEFEEVRDMIEAQAEEQAEMEALNAHAEQLRDDADVETHL